jgi:asparagine synthase (glutamine-hydrolysing)
MERGFEIKNVPNSKLSKFPFSNLLANTLDLIHPDLALKLYNAFKPVLPKYTNFRDKYIKLRNVLKAKDTME